MEQNYCHGDGVAKDATEAVKWYRKALLRNRASPLIEECLEVRALTLSSELYWVLK